MYHSKDIYVKSQETFNTFTVYKTIKTARSQRHSRSLNDKFYLLFRTLCRAGDIRAALTTNFVYCLEHFVERGLSKPNLRINTNLSDTRPTLN